jgi:hypothetical protein
MASERARPRAPPFIDPPGYVRHRPEATLLYHIVERHYPAFVIAREAAGRPLPFPSAMCCSFDTMTVTRHCRRRRGVVQSTYPLSAPVTAQAPRLAAARQS